MDREELRNKCIDAYKRANGKLSPQDIAKFYGVPRETCRSWIRNDQQTRKKHDKSSVFEELGLTPSKSVPPVTRQETVHDSQNGSVVLVIPDMHCPWEHRDALQFLIAVRAKYKPNLIVNLGDEVDFYGMSRFDHDPDVINPGAELSLAIKHLLPFYREFPNVLICQSNHTHRVHAKAQKSGLPSSTIKSIEEILKTPEGWIYKYCHTIDGVDYKHGTGKSGAMAHINHTKATGRSTCIGHIHAYAAVNYLRPGLFAANFGCLIDKHADCFKYASDMDDNIVMGCGIVIGGKEALFIPMHTDSNDRWVGSL